MCGRYTLACPDQEALLSGLPFEEFSETRIQFRPRYNVGPGQRNPVVYLSDTGPVLADALWGLERHGGGLVINARSETAEGNRMFRDAFRDGRCLVPADGFFEWRKGARVNQPYLFQREDTGLFLMAGLWERGRYVILTRQARGEVIEIHHRMPIILDPDDAHEWLNKGRLTDEASPVTRTAVSPRVNSIDHDDPDCLAPTAQQSLPFDK